uniref:Myb-like domain-containing protein n=1 Tax=Angiostrongylus cantonensis TaxID=6313 RepID=A0A158P8Z5_ANGCA
MVHPIAAPTPIPLSNAQPSSPYAAMMAVRKYFAIQHLIPIALLRRHHIALLLTLHLHLTERPTPPKQLKQKRRELARPVSPPPAVREEPDYDGPEWCIIEDQALLTAIRNEEIMCHSFERLKTSLRYNWEYVSGFVNRVTRFYRSPRQCSLRYQTVIRPQESGLVIVVDPLSKKPRKVPLTSAEVVHLRKGRVTTDLQYSHDAGRLREAAVLGKLRLVDSLTVCQNESKELRRSNPRPLELSGRLPPAQESRLSLLGVRYATAQYPDIISQIINSLEDRRIIQEMVKKKLAELQANNEGPSSPPHPVMSVCVRPPAVPAGPDIVQSRIPIVVAVPQLMPTAPRMFVQQSNQSGDRPYVVPQQQIRMVSTQRLPPQKRTLGQKSPVTAVVVPSRAVQSPQLHAVPRGFMSQGARIMNVVMAPSGNVTTTSSSQSISLQSGSQPGGGAIISSVASTARHPSPFSETAGVSVKRQLLSQSRQLGTVSRGNSPQTVAQVVIAPLPQPLSGEPPPPAPAVPPLPFTQTQTEELPQRPSSP